MIELIQRYAPTAIIVILYAVGLVGLSGPWMEDLVHLTPYNLLVTAGLLLWQARPDARTWGFALFVLVSSYLVEMLGVQSGIIFGRYAYDSVLGVKLFGTPLLIGVNWLILVMSVGPLVARLRLPLAQSVLVAALIMVGVDMVIEPVAMHLGFWSWEEDVVPLRNYIAWGVVSALYFALFFTLPVKRENDFAPVVLGAQLCFFAGIIMVNAVFGMERFTYLALDLATLSFPLLRSFEHRIRYWRKWRGLFTGIGVMAVVFLIWDAIFTANGVWGFAPRYLTGPHIARLPLEEVLFFLVVPYSCTFIYEVMRYFVRRDVLGRIARPFCMVLLVVLVVVGIWHIGRIYTAITFLSAAGLLSLHLFLLKSPYLGRFLLSYAVVLVPFVLVNGILTGTLLEEPVVWYNNAENLGIRVGTIPLEDSMYLLFFLLLTITFYELPLKRAHGDLPPPVQGHGED